MTDNECVAFEVERFVRHVQDFADKLAERLLGLAHAEADALLDQELVRLAACWKDLEANSGAPEVAPIGYNVSAVIRTRVAEYLKSH